MEEQTTTAPAQNETVAEASNQAAPPAAEPTTSAPATTAEPQEPATADTAQKTEEKPAETEAERQPVRPAERRIQNLIQENKALKEQLGTDSIPNVSPQAPRLSELVAGKESIDPAELDKLGEQVYNQAAQTARGLSSLEVQQLRQEMIQREAIAESERQASILPSRFDELNSDNPAYNPRLEEQVVKVYQQLAVRQDAQGRKYIDPSVNLTDVANDLVGLARASAEQGKAQSSATLERQADNAAVTPNSDSPVEKSFQDMSLQEQEDYLRKQGHDI